MGSYAPDNNAPHSPHERPSNPIFPPFQDPDTHSTFLNYKSEGGTAVAGTYDGTAPSSYNIPGMDAGAGKSNLKQRRNSGPLGEPASTKGDAQRLQAINDLSNSGSRSWTEKPLVLGLTWVAVIGIVWFGWVYLEQFNKSRKLGLAKM